MSNLFDNEYTKLLKDKVSKDFIYGLYLSAMTSKEKLDVDRIMKLDDALVVDQNKKAEHLKGVFNSMES